MVSDLIDNFFAELPLRDEAKAASLLATTLAHLQKSEMKPDVLSELLEKLNDTIVLIAGRGRLRIASKQLSHQAKYSAGEEIDRLQQIFAELYLSLLSSQNSAHLANASLQQRVLPIHRALYHLSDIQKWRYKVFADVPSGFWPDCHYLYQKFTQMGVSYYPFTITEHGKAYSSTVIDWYKRMLLLAMANTSRMHAGETDALYSILESWVALVHIDDGSSSESLFVMDLEIDQGPIYRALHQGSNINLNIDLSHVVARLQELLTLFQQQSSTAITIADTILTKSIVERLLKSWEMQPTRLSPRKKKTGSVRIDSPAIISHRKQFTDWNLIDVSNEGYCLEASNMDNADLEPGDILSICLDDNANTLGIVRWIKCINNNKVRIGVQVISESIQPIAVRHAEGAREFAGYLLTGDDKEKQVLVPSALYATGETIEINIEDACQRFKVKKDIYQAESYAILSVTNC